MLKIEEGVIYITRGDDAVIDAQLNMQDGATYEVKAGDIVALTVRKLPSAESPIVLSAASVPGSTRIIINADDTKEAMPGKYSADIQLKTADGKRYTVWPSLEGNERYTVRNLENFVIMPEVTMD